MKQKLLVLERKGEYEETIVMLENFKTHLPQKLTDKVDQK